MQTKKQRIEYLDTFRFLTVTFAIVSHVFADHEFLSDNLSVYAAFGKSITRTAAPALLVLFGLMVEMYYFRKFNEDPRRCIVSLVHRAFLCYLAFVTLGFLDMVIKGELERLPKVVLMIGAVQNGNIFKIYAILLLLTVPLLWIRKTLGPFSVLFLAASLWGVHWYWIAGLDSLDQPLLHMGSLVFGVGGNFGPTVLHSSILLTFGMAMGGIIAKNRDQSAWSVIAAIVFLGSVSILGGAIWSQGIVQVAMNIADIDIWRANHHQGYYAYGIIASVVILLISMAIARYAPAVILRPINAVGGATMMYFFFANASLILPPDSIIASGLMMAIFTAIYLTVFVSFSYKWATSWRNWSLIKRANLAIIGLIERLFSPVFALRL